MIMILKSCEGDDKSICEHFLPDITKPENKLGVMYNEVKQVLYESNELFNMKKETEVAQNKAIKFGTRSHLLDRSANQKREMTMSEAKRIPRRDRSMMSPSPGYKTLLKSNKNAMNKPIDRLNYGFYNLLEKRVLNMNLDDKEQYAYSVEREKIDGVLHKIKILSIELERKDPLEWNTFLDVALES